MGLLRTCKSAQAWRRRNNPARLLAEQVAVDRAVGAAEIACFYERKVRRYLRGVTPTCVRAEACLYTTTPDEDFLIDVHDDSDDVLLVSACSGHGFKHSAALGEAVAEWAAVGRSTLSLEPFRRQRLA